MTAGGGTGKRSNLQLRVFSAIVLIIVVLAATWFGGFWFRVFVVAMSGGIFHEWLDMRKDDASGELYGWPAFAVLAIILLLDAPLLGCVAALGAGLVWLFAAWAFSRATLWPLWGLLYAGLPAIALSFLREEGLVLVILLFVVVWATDIMAYFTGRSLDGPKLAPSISPGKTWSGAIGGAAFGLAGGLAVAAFVAGASLGVLVTAGLISLALSVVSQAGDLFESAVKRRNGVKDSGAIIPGHGGVMDRVDGLIPAAILLYAATLVLGPSVEPLSPF
ncbi:phosphatidate cytidylyltransferase [Nitratireductor luteus]|uniref:phosphatidate cytidylyltransferase n=1 Tax=Nitratireductor luteus TaxID=2976980 RepID=UPI002240565C|nr:phosphatidate cytidylyltransferase [Nitratireductor luteus]